MDTFKSYKDIDKITDLMKNGWKLFYHDWSGDWSLKSTDPIKFGPNVKVSKKIADKMFDDKMIIKTDKTLSSYYVLTNK